MNFRGACLSSYGLSLCHDEDHFAGTKFLFAEWGKGNFVW